MSGLLKIVVFIVFIGFLATGLAIKCRVCRGIDNSCDGEEDLGTLQECPNGHTSCSYIFNGKFCTFLCKYSYLPNKRTVRNKRAHGKMMPKKISVHMLFSSAYDMLIKSVHMGNFDPQK